METLAVVVVAALAAVVAAMLVVANAVFHGLENNQTLHYSKIKCQRFESIVTCA